MKPLVVISHSGHFDEVKRIHEYLGLQGVRCFLDVVDLPMPVELQEKGNEEWLRDWNARIIKAIDACKLLLVILTKECLDSKYVHLEVQQARGRDVRILTVRLEDVEPTTDPLNWIMGASMLHNAFKPLEEELPRISEEVIHALRTLKDQKKDGSSPRSPSEDLSNLIEQAWVEGYLNPTLQGLAAQGPAQIIDGPFTTCPSSGRPTVLFTDTQPGRELYDRAANWLLIGGVRGSGKTVFMLRVVRGLLPKWFDDQDRKCPVILNVRTWVDPHRSPSDQRPLGEWIRSQIENDYRLSPDRIGELVGHQDLIYCFDGLDEICEDLAGKDALGAKDALVGDETRQRAAYQHDVLQVFARELGEFPKAGVIVTAGETVERVLSEASLPFSVVRLVPWTDDTFDSYLRSPKLAALRRFLEAHPRVRTRLMASLFELQTLANILQGDGAVGGEGLIGLEEPDEQGSQFLDYIYRVQLKNQFDRFRNDVAAGRSAAENPRLSRRHLWVRHAHGRIRKFLFGSDEGEVTPNRTVDSLAKITSGEIESSLPSIADYLGQAGQGGTFRLDILQPDELPEDLQRRYRSLAAYGVGTGIFATTGPAVFVATMLDWLITNGDAFRALWSGALGLAGLAVASVVGGLGYRFTRGPAFGLVLGVACAIGRVSGVAFSVSEHGGSPPVAIIALQGEITLVVAMVMFGIAFYVRSDDPMRILAFENWETDRSKLLIGLAVSTFAAVAFGIKIDWARGFCFGLVIALFFSLFFWNKPREAPVRLYPNQSIVEARRSSMLYVAKILFIACPLFGLGYGLTFHTVAEGVSNAVLALCCSVFFFFFGGLSWVKNWALLKTLDESNLLPSPRRVGRVLEAAVRAGILRQVGSGYIFASNEARQHYQTKIPHKLKAFMWGMKRGTN